MSWQLPLPHIDSRSPYACAFSVGRSRRKIPVQYIGHTAKRLAHITRRSVPDLSRLCGTLGSSSASIRNHSPALTPASHDNQFHAQHRRPAINECELLDLSLAKSCVSFLGCPFRSHPRRLAPRPYPPCGNGSEETALRIRPSREAIRSHEQDQPAAAQPGLEARIATPICQHRQPNPIHIASGLKPPVYFFISPVSLIEGQTLK